jgi:hypothetical protein
MQPPTNDMYIYDMYQYTELRRLNAAFRSGVSSGSGVAMGLPCCCFVIDIEPVLPEPTRLLVLHLFVHLAGILTFQYVTWRDAQAMFVDAHNVQLREPAWNCARQSRLSYAWPKCHWQNEYLITFLDMLSISLNLSLYFFSEIDRLRFRDKDLNVIGTPE